MLLALSCRKEAPQLPVQQTPAQLVKLELCCEPLDMELRSSVDEEALTRISNANYYLFSGGKLVEQRYFESAADFIVPLSSEGPFNLYILVNVGPRPISASTRESSLAEVLDIDYGGADSYRSTIASYGFPMAGIIEGFDEDSGGRFPVKRLVHTLMVKASKAGLEGTEIEFTGVNIRQAARDVRPFSSGSKASAVIDGADGASLESADMEALNRGETVLLYMLENMRGELIPGNSDWKRKVPSAMISDSDLATYLEISARVQTPSALYENVIYRCYLGTSASDFNVRRSSYTLLDQHFVNRLVESETWRIEPGAAQLTGRVEFQYPGEDAGVLSPSGVTASQPFYLASGFVQNLFVYRSNPGIRYRISSDDPRDLLDFTIVPYDSMHDLVQIRPKRLLLPTTVPAPGDAGGYSFFYGPSSLEEDTAPVQISLTSEDGLLSAGIKCYLLQERCQVIFYYRGYSMPPSLPSTEHDGKSYLRMFMWNPMQLEYDLEISGTVYGAVTYLPSWAGSWQVATGTSQFYNSVHGSPTLLRTGMEGIPLDFVKGYREGTYWSSIEESCMALSKALRVNHNHALGQTWVRWGIPRRVELDINFIPGTFRSGQRGLRYDGDWDLDALQSIMIFRNKPESGVPTLQFACPAASQDGGNRLMTFSSRNDGDWTAWGWEEEGNRVYLRINGNRDWNVSNRIMGL